MYLNVSQESWYKWSLFDNKTNAQEMVFNLHTLKRHKFVG